MQAGFDSVNLKTILPGETVLPTIAKRDLVVLNSGLALTVQNQLFSVDGEGNATLRTSLEVRAIGRGNSCW